LVASDGTGEISTNLPLGLEREPHWSLDGQWIVFTDEEHEDGLVLHFMRSDGSRHIKYQPSSTTNQVPTWAPDGKSIAYWGWDNQKSGILTLNVDCLLQGETCEPKQTFLADGYYPDWSPNGKQIAYVSLGYRGIFVMNVDGAGEVIRIAPNLEYCHKPQWSPYGDKIAFSCYGIIYTANADGSELKKVTEPGGSPRWTPDGNRIAFISGRDGLGKCVGGLCGSGGIYSDSVFLMDVDGSNVQRLSKRDDEEILWYTWLPKRAKSNPENLQEIETQR
jgi:Tol biopolymer transport system component